jgi:ABC-type phosphate transport system substrate-binding protein
MLLTLTTFLSVFQSRASAVEFYVVVNPSNEVEVMDQKRIADIFLKRSIFWTDGITVLPIDQRSDSAVRDAFSIKILRRPTTAVRSYWQQLIFSGKGVPPVELKTDAEVVSFVSANSNAIGYVSTGTDLRGLKIIKIR